MRPLGKVNAPPPTYYSHFTYSLKKIRNHGFRVQACCSSSAVLLPGVRGFVRADRCGEGFTHHGALACAQGSQGARSTQRGRTGFSVNGACTEGNIVSCAQYSGGSLLPLAGGWMCAEILNALRSTSLLQLKQKPRDEISVPIRERALQGSTTRAIPYVVSVNTKGGYILHCPLLCLLHTWQRSISVA